MERRQIFDIIKYEHIQYLGNITKDTLPFILNNCVQYKFNHDTDDINEQIQRFLYYEYHGTLTLDQRYMVRTEVCTSMSTNYDTPRKYNSTTSFNYDIPRDYNIAFLIQENNELSCRWLVVLYGQHICVGFNMFTHDAFRGNTGVMVNILDGLNMNSNDIKCSYGMPTGIGYQGFSGFYQITGINSLPLKYTFMERLIHYFVKYYKDEDALIEKRKSHEIKIRNKYDKGFGYYKIINAMESFGCIDDFRDACNLIIEIERLQYEKRVKLNNEKVARYIKDLDEDWGYLASNGSNNRLSEYLHCAISNLLEDVIVEYTIFAIKWNFISNNADEKIRRKYEYLDFTDFQKPSPGFDTAWKYILSQLYVNHRDILEDAMNDETFIKVVDGYKRFHLGRQKNAEAYDLKSFEDSTLRGIILDDFRRLHRMVERNKLIDPPSNINIKPCPLYYSLYQPEDPEEAWEMKKIIHMSDREEYIENDPEWKFYNMNMKDLMNGNF